MAYDRWQDLVYIVDIIAQTITAYDPDTAQIRYSVNVGEAAFGIAVDHPDFGALYYTTGGSGTLRQVDTATGTVSSLATGLGNVTGIDLDYLARDLYFNDRANTAAYRQSLRDGTMTQVASGRQFSALKIAFD
jgi:streptogramin lyase